MEQVHIWHPSATKLFIKLSIGYWYAEDMPLTAERWKTYKSFTVKGKNATVWRANESGLWLYTATLDDTDGPVHPQLAEGKLTMREAIGALERAKGNTAA